MSMHRTSPRDSERGHLMIGVVVLVAIMLIFSTVVFQAWDQVARRDNEAEMIFRAQEIVRALVRFREDRGALPGRLEDLIEPGQRGQYYIRHLYKDPLVRDGRWGLLYMGPGGEIIDPNNSTFELDPDRDGTALAFGDADRDGPLPQGPGRELTNKQERAAAHRARKANQGKRISPQRASVGALDAESEMAGGTVLAGLTIAGVRTLSEDKPFRVYLNEEQYENWLFTVLDLDQARVPGTDRNPGAGNRGSGPGGAFGGFDRQGRGRGAGRFDRGSSRGSDRGAPNSRERGNR